MKIAIEDKDGNNMLHLVGDKAKGDTVNNIRGVGSLTGISIGKVTQTHTNTSLRTSTNTVNVYHIQTQTPTP